MSAPAPARLRPALLRWYDRSRRDLPWRRTRDPYAIWISETMLQQTRVETVIPYYERFLARFPDVDALADAEPDELYRHWAGLGYYSRARNLRAAAREVVDRFGGRLPEDAETLRGLPGIGPYTAGALASIAFDRPEPVVDGNVARVLARLLDIRDEISSALVRRRLWQTAGALARGPRPGDFNQALMELGATQCTPRAPRCPDCPVAFACQARAAGDPAAIPVKAPRAQPRQVRGVAALVRRGGRVLLVCRPDRGLLGGLWELPGGDLAAGEVPAAGLRRLLRERTGLAVAAPARLGAVSHGFTHFRLRLEVFACTARPGARVRLDGFARHRWLSPRAVDALPQSTAGRKAIALALARAGA